MAIIGVSGKIGSGKDLTGKIIQYLTSGSADIMSYDEYQTSQSKYRYNSNWKIRKFADKIKDMVCLILGCTREELEDSEFKNKELAEEWWRYELPNGSLIDYLDKNQPEFIRKYKLVKLTPRLLLQLLGTECGRQIIHPNIWVNSLFADYIPNDKGIYDSRIKSTIHHKSKYPKWIITDLRFPNEKKAIEDRGGIIIRVNRNPHDRNFSRLNPVSLMTQIQEDTHESEIALDDSIFLYTINNNGSIEELIVKVKEILIKEKII